MAVGGQYSSKAKNESPRRANWLGAAMTLPALAWLGEVLIKSTHHRPLGAATFATLAVVMWVMMEILSRYALNSGLGTSRVQLRRICWGLSLILCSFVLLRSFT